MDRRTRDMELVASLRSSDALLAHASITIEELWQTNDALSKDYDIVRKEVDQYVRLFNMQRQLQHKGRFWCGIGTVIGPALVTAGYYYAPEGSLTANGVLAVIGSTVCLTVFCLTLGTLDWADAKLPEDKSCGQ